jgi:hypothetical protein
MGKTLLSDTAIFLSSFFKSSLHHLFHYFLIIILLTISIHFHIDSLPNSPVNLLILYLYLSFLRRKKDRGNEVGDNITGKRREVMRWRIERNGKVVRKIERKEGER